jgi:hypothetical protein
MTTPDYAPEYMPATIAVASADTPTEKPPVVPVPAAPGSALAALRDLRKAKLDALHLELPVPRWADDGGPDIRVRYIPADPAFMNKAYEARKRQNPRPTNWMVLGAADILVASCKEVFAVEDGREISLRDGDPNGSMTRFDPDLAYTLGVETKQAVDVARALYLTDGDLIAAVNTVAEWSGISVPAADADFLAN